ncbi:MAG: hypothetical protein DRP01_03780 [Archaeoglobales archaeon]|nr:MAG: hypothetical protein DRP01_03780 [Archaeoglobales archaeon]
MQNVSRRVKEQSLLGTSHTVEKNPKAPLNGGQSCTTSLFKEWGKPNQEGDEMLRSERDVCPQGSLYYTTKNAVCPPKKAFFNYFW